MTSYVDYAHMKQIKDCGYKDVVIETAFRDPCPRAIWINSDPSKGILADPKMHWAINYCSTARRSATRSGRSRRPPAQYPWADYTTNERWKNNELANKYTLTSTRRRRPSCWTSSAPRPAGRQADLQGQGDQLEISPRPLDGDPSTRSAELLASELEKLGVDAAARSSYSGTVHDEKFQRGDYDIDSHWLCGFAIRPRAALHRLGEQTGPCPIGKNAVNGNKYALQEPEFDEVAKKLDGCDPTDPRQQAAARQGAGAYFQELPLLPVIQTDYPSYFNTTFWTGWPTDEDLYQVPLNWWAHFIFVLGKLEATGQRDLGRDGGSPAGDRVSHQPAAAPAPSVRRPGCRGIRWRRTRSGGSGSTC